MRLGSALGFVAMGLWASTAAAQQAPTTALNQLTHVQVVDGAVEIACSGRPNFTSLNLQAPPRLVLDFADTVLVEKPHEILAKVPGLKGLRTESFHSDTGAVARVVLTLEPDADADIAAAPGNVLRVKVLGAHATAVAKADPGKLDFAKADADARARAAADAENANSRAADAEAKAAAESKARADAEAKAAAESRARADAEAKAQAAEEKLKRLEAERAAAEAKADAESKARAQAEAQAKQDHADAEAKAKAAADAKARADAAEKARLAEEARHKEEEAAAAEKARLAEAQHQKEEAAAAEQARLAQQAIDQQRAEQEKRHQDDEKRRQKEARATAEQAERDLKAAEAKSRAEQAERDRLAQRAKAQAEAEARAEQEHLAQQREAERSARLAEARAAVQDRPMPARAETRVASANPTDHVAVRAGLKDVSLVGFRQGGQGGRVFIRANDAVAYTVTETSPTLLVVELQDARIAQRNGVLPLDTSFFPGPVAMITPSEDKRNRTVRVEIKLKQKATYSARLDGSEVVVEFPTEQ
ncbi:MAG: AMIN domain-containing protein [Deltaproteobacteria bacterium]|nr:AMIN domain-containing protein [Deltaproteobacteria bacterium]